MTDRWVIVAPERGARPSDFLTKGRTSDGGFCPLCPGNEASTPPAIHTIRDEAGDWLVRVIPNRFPAVRVEEPLSRKAAGIYDWVSGFGAHEVIVETREHDLSLWEVGEKDREEVLAAFRERLADLGNDRRLRWAIVFKNRGAEAGATLRHEHSQLLALPLVPREARERWEGSRAYFRRTERCVYCDVAEEERRLEVRMVEESRSFLAFCPYASRAPFETWILPRNHASDYSSITQEEIADLSRILAGVMGRIDRALERPSINMMLHSAPLQERASEHFHWHLEIAPATQRMGGFEWGAGAFINPTPPEEAARFLRGMEES